MVAPVLVTVLMILYYVAYFSFLVWLLPGVWKYIFGVAPVLFTVVTVKVCIERIHEIKEGEEDDISKY